MNRTWKWTASSIFLASSPVEDIPDVCLAAGFAGIEAAERHFEDRTESQLEAIGSLFRSAGLEIPTFHLPYSRRDDLAAFYETDRLAAVDRIKDAMHRARALGASICIQHPTTHQGSVEVEGFAPYMRQLSRSLETLLPVAESLDLTIALENSLPRNRGRFGSTAEHQEIFLRELRHPRLGLCLDTGHAQVAGGPAGPAGLFDAMSERLVAFHLQDNAGDRDSHLAPGRGLVDWTGIFQRLARMRFGGAVCIEAPPFAPGPPYSDAAWRELVERTEELAAEALSDDRQGR